MKVYGCDLKPLKCVRDSEGSIKMGPICCKEKLHFASGSVWLQMHGKMDSRRDSEVTMGRRYFFTLRIPKKYF